MAEKSRIYLDSCCFIDIAKQVIGNLDSARAKDVWHTRQILEANKEGDLVAYTSVLSIVECTHADAVMDQRVRDLFTRLLTSGQYVVLVQPTPFIATDGRDLRWRHEVMLRGADYLHVASGLAVKCAEFLTTDEKIRSQTSKIEQLGMRVVAPADTLLLPDHYRQEDFLDDTVAEFPRETDEDNKG